MSARGNSLLNLSGTGTIHISATSGGSRDGPQVRQGDLGNRRLDQLLQTMVVSMKDSSMGSFVSPLIERIDNIDVTFSIVRNLITRADPSTDWSLQRRQCQ